MSVTPKLVVVIAGSRDSFLNYCEENNLDYHACKYAYTLYDVAGLSSESIDLRFGYEAFKTVAYQHVMSRGWAVDKKKSHAVECDKRSHWVQTYASRNEKREITVFEFRCVYHEENFWLEVPKSLMSIIK